MDKKLAALRKARERVQKTLILQMEQCEKRVKALEDQIRDRKNVMDAPRSYPDSDRKQQAEVLRDLLESVEIEKGRHLGRWLVAVIVAEARENDCGGEEAVRRVIEDRMIPDVYRKMLQPVDGVQTTTRRHLEIGYEIIVDLKKRLAACLRALRKLAPDKA